MEKMVNFLYKILDAVKANRLSFAVVSLAVFLLTALLCQKLDISSFLTAIATCGLVWIGYRQTKILDNQYKLSSYDKKYYGFFKPYLDAFEHLDFLFSQVSLEKGGFEEIHEYSSIISKKTNETINLFKIKGGKKAIEIYNQYYKNLSEFYLWKLYNEKNLKEEFKKRMELKNKNYELKNEFYSLMTSNLQIGDCND